jgi:hypothetical protein
LILKDPRPLLEINMAKIHARSELGDYFVAFNLATRKRVNLVRKEASPGQLLGQALVKAGVCDYQLCEEVAGIQKLYRTTAAKLAARDLAIVLDEKTLIGDILVALGYLTPETKQEWLDYQSGKREKGEDPGRLGELLVENQVCSRAQRDLAMKVQDWMRGV